MTDADDYNGMPKGDLLLERLRGGFVMERVGESPRAYRINRRADPVRILSAPQALQAFALRRQGLPIESIATAMGAYRTKIDQFFREYAKSPYPIPVPEGEPLWRDFPSHGEAGR